MKHLLICITLIVAAGCGSSRAAAPAPAAAAAPREVNLLSMGDWGQVGRTQAEQQDRSRHA